MMNRLPSVSRTDILVQPFKHHVPQQLLYVNSLTQPDAIRFGASQRLKKAQILLSQLNALQGKGCLSRQEQEQLQQCLDQYRSLFNDVQHVPLKVEGISGQTVEIKNSLSMRELKDQPKNVRDRVLKRLASALSARIGATRYHTRTVQVGQNTYQVNTPWVQLQQAYSAQEIGVLLKKLEEKGVFRLHTHPATGLIRTSETANEKMVRQWLTDGSKNGMIQREKDPENWKKVVLVHAGVMNMETGMPSATGSQYLPGTLEAIEQAVQNPDWYRQDDEKNLRGIPHIFQPETVRFDPQTGAPVVSEIRLDNDWFNQKRLESEALILGDFIDTLRAGLIEQKPWGFTPDFLDSGPAIELVQKAIVNLTRFFMAINTNPATGQLDFAAPSASSWEEKPFAGGMTSDIADTVVAFEKLKDLMFNPQYNTAPIQRLRKELTQIPGGEALADPAILNRFIRAGRRQIDRRVVTPLKNGELPMQNPSRKPDTSLILLAASDYRFDPKDPIADATLRLGLLQSMKQELLGDYGMRRYNEFSLEGETLHDSYLNDCYHMPPELRYALRGTGTTSKYDHASGDSSSIEALKDRQALSSPEHAAEWCLGVSATLQGLARAKTVILEHLISEGRKPAEAEKKLLKILNAELDEFTNRNLALIVAPMKAKTPVIRSDGSVCPENSVMECYEIVRDLNGRTKRVPGAHTLPWGASQLFDGLRRTERAHALEERLHLLK